MIGANGSTSSKDRMKDMVNKVTVYKDKQIVKKNKDGTEGPVAVNRKFKEVSQKRVKRMSKRGWKEKTTPTPRYTISDLKGGDEGPTGPEAP